MKCFRCKKEINEDESVIGEYDAFLGSKYHRYYCSEECKQKEDRMWDMLANLKADKIKEAIHSPQKVARELKKQMNEEFEK